MALGLTNRGKLRMLEGFFQGSFLESGFSLLLITNTTPPTVDTNVFSELEEIAAGNGYASGGIDLPRDAVSFAVSNEDDTLDKAHIVLKTVEITAVGGSLPPSGSGTKFVIIADNNAMLGSREVFAFAELTTESILAVDQILRVKDLTINVTQP